MLMAMSKLLRALSRYRPRIPTAILLIVIAAMIVLATLSVDVRDVSPRRLTADGLATNVCYGWPLAWRGYTIVANLDISIGIVDWHYRASRLAGSRAVWFLMLAAPAAACEWLLRRYRPCLRWSLRTMLIAVALFGSRVWLVLCGP